MQKPTLVEARPIILPLLGNSVAEEIMIDLFIQLRAGQGNL